MALPSYLQTQNGLVLLRVKAQPRASRNAIGPALGDELKVQMTAPPVDSAANEALVEFLADLLDCPRSAIRIIRGATSRHKVIAIRGITGEDVAQKLNKG